MITVDVHPEAARYERGGDPSGEPGKSYEIILFEGHGRARVAVHLRGLSPALRAALIAAVQQQDSIPERQGALAVSG